MHKPSKNRFKSPLKKSLTLFAAFWALVLLLSTLLGLFNPLGWSASPASPSAASSKKPLKPPAVMPPAKPADIKPKPAASNPLPSVMPTFDESGKTVINPGSGAKGSGKGKIPKSPYLSAHLESPKMIYGVREGLQMKLILKAKTPVDLCLAENPLTQMNFSISRAGRGVLTTLPVVLQEDRRLSRPVNTPIHLEPGQSRVVRFNLRQLQFIEGERWLAGDYGVSGSFLLCEQGLIPDRWRLDYGQETPIPFENNIFFMIAQ